MVRAFSLVTNKFVSSPSKRSSLAPCWHPTFDFVQFLDFICTHTCHCMHAIEIVFNKHVKTT